VEDILNIFTGVPSPKKQVGGVDWPTFGQSQINPQWKLGVFYFFILRVLFFK
jgi:hypothetical protein